MKKGLIVLGLLMAVLFSACTKESSVEKTTAISQDNTWRFNLGSTEYSGLIDTSYVEDFSGVQLLSMDGLTPDGRGQLYLSFGGLDLQVGDYFSPFASIVYVEDNEAVFTSSPIQQNFKLVVTELTAEKVVGTFSGTVNDSESGAPLTITNGRFSALR
ncbi:hypothetical protein [Flavihumibacter sp. UBA7668]|uniref:hypothetical protein n=1 Tax=Flavihumibacter sp. UBA7668 TaxID=1946542 RepID=UPI0025BF5D68|nr:hypothetical protein [Flavihumibacter sp. UBA7668]